MLKFTNSIQEEVTSYSATVQGSALGATVALDYYLYEDNESLPFRAVYAVVDWNDGSFPTVYERQAQPIHFTDSKFLKNGTYRISINGRNYRTPQYDSTLLTIDLTILPNYTIPNPPFYIYGPILPRDTGHPNKNEWLFDIDSDIKILESSVKMLLKTKKGERVMEPQYGTGLQSLLFENDPATVIGLATQEVSTAIARWEPRVKLLALNAKNNGDRSVSLDLTLLSKLSQQPFEANVVYER